MEKTCEADVYEVVLINTDKVADTHVGAVLLFDLKISDELCWKIIEEVEANGKAPCFCGSLDEAEKVAAYLAMAGVPFEISKV